MDVAQIDSRSAFAAACRRVLTSASSFAARSMRSCCVFARSRTALSWLAMCSTARVRSANWPAIAAVSSSFDIVRFAGFYAGHALGSRAAASRERPAVIKLDTNTRRAKPPALPKGYPAVSKKWWQTVWASPMAAVYLEADVSALVRLAGLVGDPDPSPPVLAEIRQLEDRFGLSPLACRRLQWEIEQTTGTETPAVAGQDQRWLRAVSD